MDKTTRSLIQRATQAARELLEREYAEQLEGVFDLRLDGRIAERPGEHLDAGQCVLRGKLVTAVDHQRAGGLGPADAVAATLREAAFTTLNRFVALKMLEARELVQECLTRGDQSPGFKEFTGLAPGLVQLADHGYRLYLESLFDEIGREVRVLFDRRDPAGLLWPRRQALLDLVAILNQPELAGVWAEDETIGWVYQYFNGEDERRKMRDASQAPRNSRELAVRNQFFTPRYVVQFLTDNTLGRTWVEMRQGKTRLVESCEYLVRRASEVFLAEGEAAPPEEADEDASQEELLKRTVHVPFRAKKDPRDLKVLDPACGSGHFLLYAFDLLLAIYEEAWADEGSPASAATGRPLREEHQTLDALRAAAPGLILRHNLHGIDIDPRAVQIAALALWMRAQRAFKDHGIPRGERPAITRTNVVVAEPMPGEPELLDELAESLQPRLLGDLVRKIVPAMALAAEAGSLLRIEGSIAGAVGEARRAYTAWQKELDKGYLPGFEPPARQGELDLSAIDDARFFEEAEERIVEALRRYAEGVQNGRAYRRRLFAEDAARSFGFIALCRQRYDVVLMNPPFGAASLVAKKDLEKSYPRTKNDVYAAFVERGVELLHPRGVLGAITSRTGFFLSSFQKWREEILLREAPPTVFADLGYGVMDAAMVEAAAYCLEKREVAA